MLKNKSFQNIIIIKLLITKRKIRSWLTEIIYPRSFCITSKWRFTKFILLVFADLGPFGPWSCFTCGIGTKRNERSYFLLNRSDLKSMRNPIFIFLWLNHCYTRKFLFELKSIRKKSSLTDSLSYNTTIIQYILLVAYFDHNKNKFYLCR